MRLKNLSKFILAVFVLSFLFLFCFVSKSLVQSSSASVIKDVVTFSKQADYGLPVRLIIPKIKVNSAIDDVGIAPDGSMGISKSQYNVSWFKLGSRPGEIGNAVMAGHYGRWKNGKGSVFDNLNKLRKGDKIYIEDDQHVMISFIVRKSRVYDSGANAEDVFVSTDEKSHLNLITCEGSWNKNLKSYPKRLVIFTDKENF